MNVLVVVERQRRDVGAEVPELAVLIQILLDVRQIERRHGRAFFLQVLRRPRGSPSGRRNCRRAARSDSSSRDPSGTRSSLRSTGSCANLAAAVGRHHQIGVRRLEAAAEASGGRIIHARPMGEEGVVDVFDPLAIVRPRAPAVLGGQVVVRSPRDSPCRAPRSSRPVPIGLRRCPVADEPRSGRRAASSRTAATRTPARSADSSNSALYISCRSRLPRRMSTMNTIFGLSAAM